MDLHKQRCLRYFEGILKVWILINVYNLIHVSNKALHTVFTKILNYILSQSSVVKCHRICSDSSQRRSQLWILQQVAFSIMASIRLNKKLATIYTKMTLIKFNTLYRRLGVVTVLVLTFSPLDAIHEQSLTSHATCKQAMPMP